MTAAGKRKRLFWLADELARLEAAGLRRRRSETRRLPGARIERNGRVLADFASNDYLGLATDARLNAAARVALEQAGAGSGASALVTGRGPWHVKLERVLASFESEEDAILFPTGYAANVGTLTALLGEGDIVFCDRLNHASLVDGCRLSRAAFKVYRCDALETLERRLHAAAGYQRRWIVTDGVFSMDGVIAPLTDLCALADRFEASLIVDEAHGTGVLGDHGRGVCEALGVEHRVSVRIGTLSKAIGAAGGFVAGEQDLIDYLWNHARSQMFSTSIPPATCAAAAAAVRVIQEEDGRRQTVRDHSAQLRDRLRRAGVDTLGDNGVPIVPVPLGAPERALAVGQELEQRGFFVGTIRPPTVPNQSSRLRISVCALHEACVVDALADNLIEVCGR